MKLEIFTDKLFQLAKEKNINDCEIFFTKGSSFSVKVFNNEIDDYKNAKTHGLSFRGIYKGKIGYSYTEIFDENALEMLINEVIENAGLIENDDEIIIYEGSPIYTQINSFNPELEKVSIEDKIDFVKKLETAAKTFDNRVQSVNYCLLGNSSGEKLIKNSKKLELKNEENIIYAYISVVVKEDNDIKSGYSYQVTRNFNELEYKKLASEAVQKAIKKLGAEPIVSGEYKIIIENEAMSDILGSFSGIFSAESIQKGLSKLKGKLEEKIAVSSLTLVDNPFLKDGNANRGFDDEGVATSTKNVIENGVLKTYLHNLKTAKKAGIESTGNGIKGSYKSSISIAPSNFYIKPGETSLEEMIKLQKEAILITELAGLHSGLNVISGEFSLSAEGFYIKNGKVEKPLNQITISGNFFDLIKNIETIGNDLKFSLPGASSIGSPSVLINKLDVAGK